MIHFLLGFLTGLTVAYPYQVGSLVLRGMLLLQSGLATIWGWI